MVSQATKSQPKNPAERVAASKGWERRNGMFMLATGKTGQVLISAIYGQIKKFVEHHEKLGLKLEAKPVCRRIPPWECKYRPVGSGDKIQMFVPSQMKGLDPNHPWYVPDADQYEVFAYFSQRPKPATVWLPDDYVARHGLPAGFNQKE